MNIQDGLKVFIVQPGTYDPLSHLLFTPIPTAVKRWTVIEEESGGLMLGTRMDNRVEGVRGWGVPSESIFEVSTIGSCH